jgi:glycosyltransferase involved in cell wall biosynthesis
MVGRPLKAVDRRRAGEAAAIAVNSRYTQSRVERSWGRDSTVIYPPVRVELIQSRNWTECVAGAENVTLAALPAEFLLGASRFVSYKRLELVIKAGELTGTPVVLAGGGPDADALHQRALESTVPILFVERPSNELLFALYERAAAFIFPAIEDFGMMPVEAAAAGTPVVVNAVGGAAESVLPGVTGVVIDFNSASEIKSGVERAMGCDLHAARRRAAAFSEGRFRDEFLSWARVYIPSVS